MVSTNLPSIDASSEEKSKQSFIFSATPVGNETLESLLITMSEKPKVLRNKKFILLQRMPFLSMTLFIGFQQRPAP